MHDTRNGLKLVASGSCSFAYWLFLAITFQRKIFSKIHALDEGKPKRVPYVPYLGRRNERCRQLSGNRQSRQRRNPPAHARRGLIMHAITLYIYTCTCKHKKDSHSNHVTTPQLQYMYISGLQKQVEWPRPFWSVPSVGSLKRPKHSIHNERSGTPLMTRITINICNINKLKPIQCSYTAEHTRYCKGP